MSSFTQYTTLADVKSYGTMSNPDPIDDNEVVRAIRAVQNTIDQLGWSFHDETRTNEERAGQEVKIDNEGYLQIRVDKCPVYAVAAVAYRSRPTETWNTVDSTLIEFTPTPVNTPYPRADSNLILCYVNLRSRRNDRVRVRLTYSGGFASPTPPPALNLLATRMAWWRYKQRAASFDKIAMPEVGQVIVPSALPPDIRLDLEKWKRVA